MKKKQVKESNSEKASDGVGEREREREREREQKGQAEIRTRQRAIEIAGSTRQTSGPVSAACESIKAKQQY